ncbi:MAG: AbrB/MazE/SpoVT family DNA-binding domain-containing protein [Micrococcales bacterium]|nr:AbrB/MazE/SpoVT family DNA-binding domain-containing protein [Micrococcales bacterium]
MPVATVTSKGQVTIPLAVRNDLRLQAGTRLRFVRRPDGTYLIRPATLSVDALDGFFGPWEGSALSIEEMNDRMAAAAAEANR